MTEVKIVITRIEDGRKRQKIIKGRLGDPKEGIPQDLEVESLTRTIDGQPDMVQNVPTRISLDKLP